MKKVITLLSAAGLCAASFGQTTGTFNYTGAIQKWIVPSCVTSVQMDVYGAQGGGTGGLGGRVQGTMTVTPGDTLFVYVGGQGGPEASLSPGGWNGGGTAGQMTTMYPGAGGGGASDIRIGGTALSNRKIVGGGGGGSHQINSPTGAGAGGGLVGGNVVNNGNTCMNGWATGGTQSTGGLNSTWSGTCCFFTPVPDGSLGLGGNGAGPATSCNGGDGGAGGGGGYYGGGGGGTYTAGGGGSSYTDGAITGVVHNQGVRNGNGMISLTFNGPFVTLNLPMTSFCSNWPPTPITGGSPANGTYSGPGVVGNTFTPSVAGVGTHTIVYTFTDGNGCTGVAVQTITVSLCTDVQEQNILSGLNIFPNPTTGLIQVHFPENATNVEWDVLSLNGARVLSGKELQVVSGQDISLDLNNLANGFYFLRVKSYGGEFMTKVSVQH